MGLNLRRLLTIAACVIAVVLPSAAAFADGAHDHTQFGHDITIGPGEEASDVTCFGCSVHVRGKVDGDVTTFGGGLVLEEGGEVGGDVTSFGGNIRLDKGATAGGGVTVFGGRLHRDPEASIEGDVTSFSGGFWLALIFGLPLVFLAGLVLLVVWIVRRLTRPTMPVPARV